MRKKIGIIGFGSFGTMFSELLTPHADVFVHDINKDSETSDSVTFVSIPEIATCEIIIIALPLDQFALTCKKLAKLVKPETVVMDVCSVKIVPAEILKSTLGGKCRILATHPLFGPESVKHNGGTAKGLIIAWHNLSKQSSEDVTLFFKDSLGVKILKMSPEEHDKEMAWVHGLTFFVGRALLNMNPPQSELSTHYYQKLIDLVEVEKHHSTELFLTIQRGNPYAEAIRREFIDKISKLKHNVDESRDTI